MCTRGLLWTGLLFAGLTIGCAGTRFGRVVTEITPSPTDPGVLVVRTCDLEAMPATDIARVRVGACKRFGLRRSAIQPVPVTDATVPRLENRIITGVREREGGGAVVSSCGLAADATGTFRLTACAEVEISTATLATQPSPR